MIEVKNLKKYYTTGVKAVDDISFKIGTGEIVGFLGPNGAGKSTTLKMLTGYIPPTDGQVLIDGLDISEHTIEAQKKMGYLPENNPLYYDMQLLEFLNFVLEARSIPKDEMKEKLDYVIDKLALAKNAYKRISSLSKGYKQRVGLAQAIIHNPDILILDEPTSGLDPNQVIEIRQLIKEIGKERTVIFSTHILQEVEAICDKVLIINNGKIVASGTKDELASGKSKSIITTATLSGAKEMIELALININATILEVKETTEGYKFRLESSEDIRGSIFELAKKNNFVLLEIKNESASLENLFKNLTNQAVFQEVGK